jgi:L-serine dehydratase
MDTRALLHFQSPEKVEEAAWNRLQSMDGVHESYSVDPVFYVRQGETLFTSAQNMCELDRDNQLSLGQLGLEYETALLGLSPEEAQQEMRRRYEIMQTSCADGFQDDRVDMLLLKPTARNIYEAQSQKRVAVGGLHTRAAARALAVMHTCNSRGIVCAAPTGGSAGVIPAVMITLAEEFHLADEDVIRLLFAAGSIGLIVARRSGFAAEIAGCQVEIGAAGAMAAAAVVDFAGGTVRQAADAAAIALQNTMGSVCDPVQGACEVPCHTRNAAAAANAFIYADLVLGGYHNPIPLDETLDASLSAGTMLPRELRCTAQGGIAAAPSALKMKAQR